MSVDKVEYNYDTFDIDFRKHLNRKWQVTYDPGDMKTILVEDHDGKISFILEEKYVQPMAIADQTPEDRVQLKALIDKNEDLKTAVIDANIENRQLLEEHLSSNERLNQFRQKLMFIQNGQQKDPLQESKGKILPREKEKKAIEASTRKMKEAEELREQAEQEAYEAEWWVKQEEIWKSKVDFSQF
jgi:hypothetical protein